MFKRTTQSRLPPSTWGRLLLVFCAALYLIMLFDNQHRVSIRDKKTRKLEKRHNKNLTAGLDPHASRNDRPLTVGPRPPGFKPLKPAAAMAAATAAATTTTTSATAAAAEPLPLEDFGAAGRRLECLGLVSSQVDRLDRMTLVRPPRRRATAYLATEALRVPGDFVEAVREIGGHSAPTLGSRWLK